MAIRCARLGAVSAALLIGSAAPAGQAGTVAIRAGRILTMAGPDIDKGVLLVRDGKIAAVGQGIAIPPGSTVIDAGTGWVTPGLVNAHYIVGQRNESEPAASDELSDPNTAQLLALDGLDPFDRRLERLRASGITALLAMPGRANVIGGQPAVVRLTGGTAERMTVLSPAGVKLSLGEGPKEAFGEKGRLPSTRMGSAWVVRKALVEAAEYARKRSAAPAGAGAPPPKKDLALEPLAGLLDGRLTAFVECYRADDIVTALRLVDEFHLKAVLIGATEAFKVVEEIARRKIPVIVGPMGVGPKRVETQEVDPSTAASLARAGITVALAAEEALGIGAPEELPLVAALAVRGGLPRETALRAITSTPAGLLGVGDRIGSLAPGREADITVFDADPLHYRTRVSHVLVGGRVVYARKD